MFPFARRLTPKKTQDFKSQDTNTPRIVIDESGMVIYASNAFLTLANMGQQDLGRRHISSVFTFENFDQSLQNLDPGIHSLSIHGRANTRHFQCDWLTTRDNQVYLIAAEVQKDVRDPKQKNKSFNRFVKNVESNILQDIAKPDEKQNRRSSDHIPDLQPFFNLSGDIMIVTNNRGEIIHENDQCLAFFGENQESRHFSALFLEEDKPYARGALQALNLTPRDSREASVVDFEARIVMENGNVKTTSWRAQKLGDHLYCMGQDLTALKNQRKALADREEKLIQAESIGRMGHWHWVVGQDIMEWSAQIYDIFDVEQGTFTPTLDTMRTLIDRQDLGRIDQAFQRAVIEQNDYDMEFAIRTPQGERRYIRCEGRCSLDADGDVCGLYGIMQDMTERVAYEGELQQAKDAAERSYAAKSQFLANMSHELRTPLNAIIGFSDMMNSQMLGPLGNPKYLEYTSGIKESGEHLLNLISDILIMSRIEAGKYELDLEELNITKTLDTCLHMMEGRASEGKVQILLSSFEDSNLRVIADRRGVMQVILNILSNAVKFTPENGKIHVTCTADAKNIQIVIHDSGIGIPANKLANITRPFEQVSSDYARDHEGSGLGLAITKEMVELHGGQLKIESEIDQGTCVTIKLPRDVYAATQKPNTPLATS